MLGLRPSLRLLPVPNPQSLIPPSPSTWSCHVTTSGRRPKELIERLDGLSAATDGRYAFRFLLVDDGSTDGTADRLRGLVNGHGGYEILRHDRNRGVAAAIMTGIAAARAEIVCSMDADCSYDPRQLGEMIPMLADGVDMVTASPYHPLGGVEGVPAWRLLLSRLGLVAVSRGAAAAAAHLHELLPRLPPQRDGRNRPGGRRLRRDRGTSLANGPPRIADCRVSGGAPLPAARGNRR